MIAVLPVSCRSDEQKPAIQRKCRENQTLRRVGLPSECDKEQSAEQHRPAGPTVNFGASAEILNSSFSLPCLVPPDGTRENRIPDESRVLGNIRPCRRCVSIFLQPRTEAHHTRRSVQPLTVQESSDWAGSDPWSARGIGRPTLLRFVDSWSRFRAWQTVAIRFCTVMGSFVTSVPSSDVLP